MLQLLRSFGKVLVVLCACSMGWVEAQPSSNPQLPSFKTIYTFTGSSTRNDLSFIPAADASAEPHGRLVMTGARCLVDQDLQVQQDVEFFTVRATNLVAKDPSKPADVAWCSAVVTTVKMPKSKGSFGYTGVIESVDKDGRSFVGRFNY